MASKNSQNLFNPKELLLMRSLIKHEVDFMLVGLGAAALQGAPVVTQDIDLWIKDLGSEAFMKALQSAGAIYIPNIGLNPPGIAGKGFELLDLVISMSGLKDFDQEKSNIKNIKIDGVNLPVLSLDRIIESKKAANREKDKLVLPVLLDVQKVLKANK